MVAERGIFKGEMSRNISPLNGALVTLPLLAKSLAPGGETSPPRRSGEIPQTSTAASVSKNHSTILLTFRPSICPKALP